MGKMNQAGTDRGERHETGEKEPKGASKIDRERSEPVKNGVGMGNQDRPRNNSEEMESIHTHTDTGKTVYTHIRPYGKEAY